MSSTPPPARRLPFVSARPPGPVAARHASYEEQRAYAVIGPSGVGVSTLLRVVHEESRTPTHVFGPVRGEIDWAMDWTRAHEHGERVIFIDGLPRDAGDVQWLYDSRLVLPWAGGGAIIRVERDAVLDVDYQARLVHIEAKARELSLPIVVIRNEDPEQAVVALLSESGIVS